MALQIITDHPCNDFEPILKRFLFSSDSELIRLSLRAAGNLKHPRLLPEILNALDDPNVQDDAVAALYDYDIRALPSIEKIIFDDRSSIEKRKKLIVLLGQESSDYAKEVLLRSLFVSDPRIRLTVIHTILTLNMTWVHKNRCKVLRNSIGNDVKQWKLIWNAVQDLSEYQRNEWTSSLDLLIAAMKEEMKLIRELIVYQIMLFNSHTLVIHSAQLLLENNVKAYAGAVSCLQDLLPKDLYKLTKDVLMQQTSDKDMHVRNQRPVEQYLAGLILTPPSWVNSWMQVLVLQSAYTLNCNNIMQMITHCLQSSNWLILDVALWLLGQCAPNKKIAQEMALTVPTRYLVQHKFQELVEG